MIIKITSLLIKTSNKIYKMLVWQIIVGTVNYNNINTNNKQKSQTYHSNINENCKEPKTYC